MLRLVRLVLLGCVNVAVLSLQKKICRSWLNHRDRCCCFPFGVAMTMIATLCGGHHNDWKTVTSLDRNGDNSSSGQKQFFPSLAEATNEVEEAG